MLHGRECLIRAGINLPRARAASGLLFQNSALPASECGGKYRVRVAATSGGRGIGVSRNSLPLRIWMASRNATRNAFRR